MLVNEPLTDIIEINDAIPKSYLRDILKHVNMGLTWTWITDTSYGLEHDSDNLWDKQIQSTILVDGKGISKMYDFFYPIIYILEEKFNTQFKLIERMKVNRTFTCPSEQDIKLWHVDCREFKKRSIVLYLDNSDGGTVIANKRLTGPTAFELGPKDKYITSDTKIKYVQYNPNKAVMFDSNVLHYAELPKRHKCRTVINIMVRV